MLSDFDGTISPIVGDPATAAPLPGAVDALHRLARRFRTVAVVSGRPATFLVGTLGLGEERSPLLAYGLYGAERVDPDGRVTAVATQRDAIDAVCDAARELEAGAAPGVEVERKGRSVTLHWRKVPEQRAAAEQLAASTATRHALVLRPARQSTELVLPNAPDKANAVASLAAGASAACYLGDDVGDLPAFEALGVLSRTSGTSIVRVAIASDESPAGLTDEADVVLGEPAGAVAFLIALAARSEAR
ncbi:MAG TPA: trehalose-phosphatase [Acidimicrobiales bacterium]|nr:trehalose-phosphatase [Acidimicrobiales bacterium]